MTTIAYYCCYKYCYRGEEYDATQEIEKVKVSGYGCICVTCYMYGDMLHVW